MAQEGPEEVYFDRVEVEIVNLEVFVTDRRGRPVEGLGREDFELLVDGEPTEIRNFYSAAASLAVEAPSPTPGVTAADAPTAAAEQAAAVPAEQGMSLIVLVDGRSATPGERKRALEELADHFSAGFAPGTQAMVVSLDARASVLQPFTTDGAAVARALLDLRTGAVRGYGNELEFRSVLRQLEEENVAGEAGDALFAIRSYRQKELAEVRTTLEHVARLMEGLGGRPGHKALLYVGRGINAAPGRGLFQAWRNKFGSVSERQLQLTDLELAAMPAETAPLFDRLADLANAHRVSFYSLSTGGVGPSVALAETGIIDTTSGRGWTPEIDAQFRSDLSTALGTLADATGGRAISSADYDLVARWIAEDAESLYSLGFAPPTGAAGSRHRVEVRVPGRDVEVRHRRRLITVSREQRAVASTVAAALHGSGGNPLAVEVELGAPQPAADGQVVQPLLVKIPFALMTLLPSNDGYRGEVTIYVVAADEEGRLSDVGTVEAPVRLRADDLDRVLGGVAGYRVGLHLRPGRNRIAVGVRDAVADSMSTVVVEHDVEPPPDRRGRR